MKKEGAFFLVKLPCFETFCLQTGVKTLVSETGHQLPPSLVSFLAILRDWNSNLYDVLKKKKVD